MKLDDFVKSINVLDGYEIDDVTKALLLLLDKGYITDDLAEEILDRKYGKGYYPSQSENKLKYYLFMCIKKQEKYFFSN